MAADPLRQFERWLEEARAMPREVMGDPTAMALATASADGAPSVRMVLLKGLDERGFVFFTNYESQKGRELAQNPRAALLFYWAPLERQVRITGTVTRVARAESEAYFRSRPVDAQLGVWASRQSQVILSREALEQRLAEVAAGFASSQADSAELPLPPYWGGYRLAPQRYEFWQARPGRLHDRLRYSRQRQGGWVVERLAP